MQAQDRNASDYALADELGEFIAKERALLDSGVYTQGQRWRVEAALGWIASGAARCDLGSFGRGLGTLEQVRLERAHGIGAVH